MGNRNVRAEKHFSVECVFSLVCCGGMRDKDREIYFPPLALDATLPVPMKFERGKWTEKTKKNHTHSLLTII